MVYVNKETTANKEGMGGKDIWMIAEIFLMGVYDFWMGLGKMFIFAEKSCKLHESIFVSKFRFKEDRI